MPVADPGSAVLVLLRERRASAKAWARHGLLPVTVVPGLSWTLVVPAGPSSSASPYDDPVALLGGHPVPRRLRPCAVLVAGPDRLAVRVQGPAVRAPQRWLIWTRGIGLSRVPDLPLAPPSMVGRLLAPTRTSAAALVDVLARDSRLPSEVADDLLGVLGLPGAGILSGRVAAAGLPGATRVDPSPAHVVRFDRHTADESDGDSRDAGSERGDGRSGR